jgi:tetratricopeptide (TPR) repeat protein
MDLSESLKPAVVAVLDNKEEVNGTGFFVTTDGYILTCYHVIKNYLSANKVWIRTRDGVKLEASFEEDKSRCEKHLDFAVLKVADPGPFPHVRLGKDFRKGDGWCSRGYHFPTDYKDVDFKGEMIEIADRIETGQGYDFRLRSNDPIKGGSSGSPILVERTRRVAGVANSRPKEDGDRQFFATPIKDVFARWPELERLNYAQLELPPVGELPEPDNKLPAGSKPIVPRNKLFTGRLEDLKCLANALLHSNTKDIANVVVITGWRGVGKSQLAIEFCYRYGRYLNGVHWIQANQDIATEIANCGEFMGLSSWPERLTEKVDATLKVWQEEGMHLVVFDNAEGPQVVQDWLPRISPAKFLVTSFEPIWQGSMGVQVKELKTLEIDKSKELLCKLAPRLKQSSDTDVEELANRLDNLPLALDLAGRYLEFNPDMSPRDYLDELEESGNSLDHASLRLDYGSSPTNHIPLEDTVGLSWKQLDNSENGVLAKRIFKMCGYCAPNKPIPKQLLEEALGRDVSKQMLREALMRLDRLGLTAPTEGGRILHGLLAKFAQWQDLHADGERVLPDLASGMIAATVQALESGLPEKIKILHEHLRVVTQAAENSNLTISGALLNNLGLDLHCLGDYEGARQKHERSLEIKEKVYGPDHPDVAGTLNNLGLDLHCLGDYEGAKQKHERSLEIEEKVYGPDHPDVARTLSNLGLDLQYLGDYEGAKQKHERSLEIEEKVWGPDHPEVARTLDNLGLDLRYLGDYEGAKQKHERSLEIEEKVYGPDHPEVAGTLNNLGVDLHCLGDYEGAKQKHERSLEIKEKVYGPDHPDVARTLSNLGLDLQYLGDYEGARQKHERSLEIGLKVYSPDHPEVARTLDNLGLDLQYLGDYEGAKQKHERSLEIEEKVYGPDHPDVARTLSNLGLDLQYLGDLEGAKQNLERALEIGLKVYGPDHPTTRTIKRNLESLDSGKKSG